MINARTFGLASVMAILITVFSAIQPTPGFSAGVNGDAIRQKCEFYRSKALIGNRKARAGQITQNQRATLWLRYKNCVGSKDYLVPSEFRNSRRSYN